MTTGRTDSEVDLTQYVEESDALHDEPPTIDLLADVQVHPFAASFPLLEGEEFAALVEDIRMNGLIHPIVRDTGGQIIDGRNRLRAAKLAGVEPTFIETDRDPVSYILSANVNRRHMSKGQIAMATAMAYPEATERGGRGKTAVSNMGVSADYITKARYVLRHAPDLVQKVMTGASLVEAYDEAARLKRERDEMNELRTEAADQLDSMVRVCTQLKSDLDKATAFVNRDALVRAIQDATRQLSAHVGQLKDISE